MVTNTANTPNSFSLSHSLHHALLARGGSTITTPTTPPPPAPAPALAPPPRPSPDQL